MAELCDAETETLARAFAASSAAFLERLRYLQLELNKQCACWAELSQFDMKKLSLGYRYPRNGPHDPYLEMYSERWKSYVSPQAVLLLENALRMVEGWRAARGVNVELNNFDGKTILDTTFQFCDKENFTPRFIGDKQDIFNQAVERFALSLSVTTQPLTTAAAVPVAPGAEFVDSDYAEPIFKSDLAFLFGVNPATIRRRIQSGELRTRPGTSDTAKKVRVHGDDFPAGLKRLNERKQKLSTMPKR